MSRQRPESERGQHGPRMVLALERRVSAGPSRGSATTHRFAMQLVMVAFPSRSPCFPAAGDPARPSSGASSSAWSMPTVPDGVQPALAVPCHNLGALKSDSRV